MILQKFSDFPGVFNMTFHTQRQSFQPLQQQEGVHRRQRGASIAQWHHTAATNVCGFGHGFGIDDTMIRRVGRGHDRKTATGSPVKAHGAVAATMENHPMGVGIPGGEIPLEIDGFGDTGTGVAAFDVCVKMSASGFCDPSISGPRLVDGVRKTVLVVPLLSLMCPDF